MARGEDREAWRRSLTASSSDGVCQEGAQGPAKCAEALRRFKAVLASIHTTVVTQDSLQSGYQLGITPQRIRNRAAFGHGGFWGTEVLFFPELNATVSIAVLERGHRAMRRSVLERIVALLEQ